MVSQAAAAAGQKSGSITVAASVQISHGIDIDKRGSSLEVTTLLKEGVPTKMEQSYRSLCAPRYAAQLHVQFDHLR